MTMLGRGKRSAENKAKKAEAAAKRAEELAEQARQAAEEAKTAAEEAEAAAETLGEKANATLSDGVLADEPTSEELKAVRGEIDDDEAAEAAVKAHQEATDSDDTSTSTSTSDDATVQDSGTVVQAATLTKPAAPARGDLPPEDDPPGEDDASAQAAPAEADVASAGVDTAIDDDTTIEGSDATAGDSSIQSDGASSGGSTSAPIGADDASADGGTGTPPAGGDLLAEGDAPEEGDVDAVEALPVADEPRRIQRGIRAVAGLGVVAGVLILVNLILTGLVAFLYFSDADSGKLSDARKQATYAATQAAQDLSSYDYRTLDSDFRRAAGHTTGPFRTSFETESARVKANAQQQQVVVEGTAIKTGIEEVSAKKAIALVFLNQQTVKTASAQRLPSQFTLRLTMKKVGDRWLVEKLQVL